MIKTDDVSIGVWDCTFYLTDDDGNAVKNEDGTIKMFDAPALDWSHIAESVELNELKEKTVESSRETIRIPITENDFEHELKNLVFNGEEFEWGAFYTVETERAIDVEFIVEEEEDE